MDVRRHFGIINVNGSNSAFGGPQPAQDGVQYTFVQSSHGNPVGSVSQTVSLSAGSYNLSFYEAARPGNTADVAVILDHLHNRSVSVRFSHKLHQLDLGVGQLHRSRRESHH